MSDTRQSEEGQVQCRRLGRPLTVHEHRECPYCHGKTAEVASGQHETFCDYDPEEDPINFGFPQDRGRHVGA
jgi:hypothetical protein